MALPLEGRDKRNCFHFSDKEMKGRRGYSTVIIETCINIRLNTGHGSWQKSSSCWPHPSVRGLGTTDKAEEQAGAPIQRAQQEETCYILSSYLILLRTLWVGMAFILHMKKQSQKFTYSGTEGQVCLTKAVSCPYTSRTSVTSQGWNPLHGQGCL